MRLKDFYSVKAAAEKAGIPFLALHQRIHRGSVPVTRLSDTVVLIHKTDVAKLKPARNRDSLPWNRNDTTRDKNHSLYRLYHLMMRRCYLPRHRDYEQYGAKGIKICERWMNCFQSFVEDVGLPPTESHRLERKDDSQDYEPDNCHWVIHNR